MILQMSEVYAGYGEIPVLFGIDIAIEEGEIVALLGRNGMGKTTTINSIFGLAAVTGGEIKFAGSDVVCRRTHDVARLGIALVPEGRQIFPNLSVYENLVSTARTRRNARQTWTLDAIYDLFPALRVIRHRSAGVLSGGEQQMLAIGRALMTNPLLLILDEATEGLAPRIRAEIWRVLSVLKDMRQSVLVVDKDINALGRVADRYYILEKGRSVRHGLAGELVDDPGLRSRFMGLN